MHLILNSFGWWIQVDFPSYIWSIIWSVSISALYLDNETVIYDSDVGFIETTPAPTQPSSAESTENKIPTISLIGGNETEVEAEVGPTEKPFGWSAPEPDYVKFELPFNSPYASKFQGFDFNYGEVIQELNFFLLVFGTLDRVPTRENLIMRHRQGRNRGASSLSIKYLEIIFEFLLRHWRKALYFMKLKEVESYLKIIEYPGEAIHLFSIVVRCKKIYQKVRKFFWSFFKLQKRGLV